MKKYYAITTLLWLAFFWGLLGMGISKSYTEGLHSGWFYFAAMLCALLLCLRRWKTWRKAQK